MGHELVLRRGNAIVGTTVIHGTITVVSADNPASCSVGGFKEGGLAYRFCRHCLITMHQIRQKYVYKVSVYHLFILICYTMFSLSLYRPMKTSVFFEHLQIMIASVLKLKVIQHYQRSMGSTPPQFSMNLTSFMFPLVASFQI